ncbi:MAG: GntR family transcriptional regulator [Firmicutes bacterium]|nr:GntR family transcriptional regulator [Bacillota bacterium]
MAERVKAGQTQASEFSEAPDLSASDRAFQQLRRDILRGTYRRGTPLPERPLAQALGVSHTPLREAFRRLQAEGLVTHQNGRGVVVTGLAPEEIAEIFLIRGALEGLAASLAAQRMSEQEAALLCNKAEQLLQAVQAGTRGDALDEGHLAFNEALYRGARSPRLHAT